MPNKKVKKNFDKVQKKIHSGREAKVRVYNTKTRVYDEKETDRINVNNVLSRSREAGIKEAQKAYPNYKPKADHPEKTRIGKRINRIDRATIKARKIKRSRKKK